MEPAVGGGCLAVGSAPPVDWFHVAGGDVTETWPLGQGHSQRRLSSPLLRSEFAVDSVWLVASTNVRPGVSDSW